MSTERGTLFRQNEEDSTIGGEQEMSVILSFAPLYSVDFLFNLYRFEVIKLWFVRLKLCVKLVLATFLGFVPFKQYYPSTFISSCEVISCVIELDRSYNRRQKSQRLAFPIENE